VTANVVDPLPLIVEFTGPLMRCPLDISLIVTVPVMTPLLSVPVNAKELVDVTVAGDVLVPVDC